ncbi:MAG: hypothetical protein MUF34_18945 [Polyangiaceae bacterium]|nr:hypothetical protein [Polyangiaceae bacterium]
MPLNLSRSPSLVAPLTFAPCPLLAFITALAACGPRSDAPPSGAQSGAPAQPAPPGANGTTGANGANGATGRSGAAGAAGASSTPAAAGAGGAGGAVGAGAGGAAGASGRAGAGGAAVGAAGGAGVSPSGEACASSIDDAALAPVLKAVVDALAKRDTTALAPHAHPTKGVRFSPYAYVEKGSDVVLKAAELGPAMADPKVRTWGARDGSGDPIKLTFKKYFDTFVYDRDFARLGQYARGRTIRTGNTKSNLCETYPGAAFVEYHVPAAAWTGQACAWSSRPRAAR